MYDARPRGPDSGRSLDSSHTTHPRAANRLEPDGRIRGPAMRMVRQATKLDAAKQVPIDGTQLRERAQLGHADCGVTRERISGSLTCSCVQF